MRTAYTKRSTIEWDAHTAMQITQKKIGVFKVVFLTRLNVNIQQPSDFHT